jgi:glycosyltransferase involved in cell wall biosynthesis
VFLLQYGMHPSTTGVHFEAAARERDDSWDIRRMRHGQALRLDGVSYKGSLWVDSGIRSFQVGAHAAAFPTAAFFIDVHLQLPIYVAMAGLFDHVFVAQPDHLSSIRAANANAKWLPLACPRALVETPRERVFEVGFVGNVRPGTRREAILDHLAKRFAMNDWRRSYSTEEMADVYRRSAIVVNDPIDGDLNMRFFEAMGSGAAVVMPRIGNGLREIAEEGTHFAIADFDSLDNIADVVSSLLESGRHEKIGGAARELVAAKHTYEHRLSVVVDAFREPASAPIREMSRRERARYLSEAANATASSALALEALRAARFGDPKVLTNAAMAGARAARRRLATRAVRRTLREAEHP